MAQCPTYRLLHREGDSPRGRLALIQAVAEGLLEPSSSLRYSLDNCLECRACEAACPSLVPYGAILEEAKALLVAEDSWAKRLALRSFLALLSSRAGTRGLARFGALYRRSGLANRLSPVSLRRWPHLEALHRIARQPLESPRFPRRSEVGNPQISLFPGCITGIAQTRALESAFQVLAYLGYSVDIPEDSVCCGALHRHNGFPESGDRYLAQNAHRLGNRPLVGLASACVGELRRHPQLQETWEICRFLADQRALGPDRFRPLRCRVAFHLPCSHQYGLQDSRAVAELLGRIPEIELVSLPDQALCCGAAGTYLLRRPGFSRALLAPKLDALAARAPRILVTTNTGCALHFTAGLRERGLSIEVLHPVELIARQLRIP